MADVRPPISSSRLVTGDIAKHSFAIVRRGFDTDEVRSYLQSVSRSLEALEEREQELRDAVAEAEERAAHPVARPTQRADPAPRPRRGGQDRGPGPGGGRRPPARDPDPGRGAPGEYGVLRGRASGRGGAARGQRGTGGARRQPAHRERRRR